MTSFPSNAVVKETEAGVRVEFDGVWAFGKRGSYPIADSYTIASFNLYEALQHRGGVTARLALLEREIDRLLDKLHGP